MESGTYGYVIVAAAFLIQVISFGTARSIAVYNVEFMRTFNSNAVETSLIGSINLGMFLGAGPVASALMKYWSHRKVALVGATLANIGLVCMPFAPNVPSMYIFYGVIAGLGYALVYIPSQVLSGLYFDKHKSMATGIASAGLGFGHVVFPLVINRFIHHFGWRGSFLLMAGINLHLLVFAALLRPLHIIVPTEYGVKKGENVIDKSEKYIESTIIKQTMPHGTSNTVAYQETSEDIGYKTTTNQECYELHPKDDSTHTRTHSNGEPKQRGDLSQIYNESVVKDASTTHLKHNASENKETEQTIDTGQDSSKPKPTLCQRVLAHVQPLADTDFIIYCINNVCWNAGVVSLVLFLSEYMISIRLTKDDGAIALSLLGVGTFVGSVLGGFLGNMKYFNRYMLYIFGNIGSGSIAFLFVLPFFQSNTGQFFVVTLFGCIYGNIIGLLVVVTNDLLGNEHLGDGYGCLMLTNGVGIFCGPPLIGAVIDRLGTQTPGIYISASLLVVGGLLMCIVPVHKHFLQKGTKTKQTEKDMS